MPPTRKPTGKAKAVEHAPEVQVLKRKKTPLAASDSGSDNTESEDLEQVLQKKKAPDARSAGRITTYSNAISTSRASSSSSQVPRTSLAGSPASHMSRGSLAGSSASTTGRCSAQIREELMMIGSRISRIEFPVGPINEVMFKALFAASESLSIAGDDEGARNLNQTVLKAFPGLAKDPEEGDGESFGVDMLTFESLQDAVREILRQTASVVAVQKVQTVLSFPAETIK